MPAQTYVGLTETPFRVTFANLKPSFNIPNKRLSTQLLIIRNKLSFLTYKRIVYNETISIKEFPRPLQRVYIYIYIYIYTTADSTVSAFWASSVQC